MTPTAALDFAIEVMEDRQRAVHARSTRRHLAIDEVVCKLENIRNQVAADEASAGSRDAFIAGTEPPPIDQAAQGPSLEDRYDDS